MKKTNEPANLIDELIAEGVGVETDEEYTFTASTGRAFKARRVRDADKLQAIYKRARVLAARTDKNTPEIWHPFLPISDNTARCVAFADACLIEPKVPQVELLKLARTAGSYFLEISNKVMAECLIARVEEDEAAVDDFLDA